MGVEWLTTNSSSPECITTGVIIRLLDLSVCCETAESQNKILQNWHSQCCQVLSRGFLFSLEHSKILQSLL